MVMRKGLLEYMSILFLFISCGNSDEVEEDPCPKWQIVVHIDQLITFTGNTENIDYENLSLIATDSEWNYQYAPNGNLIADKSNYVEVIKEFNQSDQIKNLRLVLGHVYEKKETQTAVGYFLLKINENTFDKIIGYYDTRCANLLLTKINYNNIEYPENEFVPIEIVKEE